MKNDYFKDYLDQKFKNVDFRFDELQHVLLKVTSDTEKNTKWRENIASKIALISATASIVVMFFVGVLKDAVINLFKKL